MPNLNFACAQLLNMLISVICLLMVNAYFDVISAEHASSHFDDIGTCQKHSSSDNGCRNLYSSKEESNMEDLGRKEAPRKFQYKADPRFQGVYTFPTDPIPRGNCADNETMHYLQQGRPVVLENCTFHKSAMKWTTAYLLENLQDENHTAYYSSNRKFLYFEEERMKGYYKQWKPPTTKRLMLFKHFVDLVRELETANNGSRAYFQSVLYVQDGVSSSMLHDIDSFDYKWLLDLVIDMNWGQDVTNLLLVGMPDVVTPAHYDTLENLYVQISGRKRVILFSPEYFASLYPYPVGHPHDRQTQVDFDDPDFRRFPKFGEIEGMEVALEPGEVLYIPGYWWHYIESERDNKTVSVNFWFEPKNQSEVYKDNENEAKNENKEEILQEEQGIVGQAHTAQEHTGEEERESLQTQNERPENKAWSIYDEEDNVDELEEEKETNLTGSSYLALLRAIEVGLFKATHNHKKVKQILEELLTGRFEDL